MRNTSPAPTRPLPLTINRPTDYRPSSALVRAVARLVVAVARRRVAN